MSKILYTAFVPIHCRKCGRFIGWDMKNVSAINSLYAMDSGNGYCNKHYPSDKFDIEDMSPIGTSEIPIMSH